MSYTKEEKNRIIDVLYAKSEGSVYKCSQLTGIDRKTIQKWKDEHEKNKSQDATSTDIPDTELIKKKIIRRVNTLVETCTDPKKLMDTYEAIVKFEKESGHNKQSIFDLIKKELEEK